MGIVRGTAVAVLVGFCASCGGGGGSGGNAGNGATGSAFGVLQLLAHEPAHEAVQVPLDATIVLSFDGDLALESLGDEDTWLRTADSNSPVPGTFSRGSNGRVAFQPAAPLAAETDYVFQLSALTCDQAGRILDVTRSFAFRTFDTTPPALVAIDVAENATGQSRTRSFTLTFDEAIQSASVTPLSLYVRDAFGTRYPAQLTVAGEAVTVDPYADLPGDRQCFVVATTAIADRAGNRLPSGVNRAFRTAPDTQAPQVLSAWPPSNQTGISPRVQPLFRFDESMDPATVEAASLLFQDEFGSLVPFAIEASVDQRALRVVPQGPLLAQRRYTLAFLLGGAAATDVSGNALAATQALAFTTGNDAAPPTVAASVPAAGETRVPAVLTAEITFDEPLDPTFANEANVMLTAGGANWPIVVTRPAPQLLRVVPLLALPLASECELTLRGGQEGLHDLAGNVLPTDVRIPFTTSGDGGVPQALLFPADGAAEVPPGVRVAVVFDAAMDPTTLDAGTVVVSDDAGNVLPGSLEIGPAGRHVRFVPATPFAPNAYYRIRVVGGPLGARRSSGNWFAADLTARFRTGGAVDGQPPTVTATVNGIQPSRRSGLVLPPSGFTVDVTANDLGSQWVDMTSIEIELAGGPAPDAAALVAAARIDYGSLRVLVPPEQALTPGQWTLTVRARDLSGNVGTSSIVSFVVAQPDASSLPFERTQVVWVRTDLDRNLNGRADFADDMHRLGFATTGDPIGTNAWVERVVLQGILAKANRLYGRGARGEPIDAGSVSLRFSTRQPIGLPHMQIAVGGLDPEGDRTRGYGDESTGVLGRAFYDYRNGNPSERNISSSPGLGVFPAEMWLYQTRIHEQVHPAFVTLFAQRFLPLCPEMGGVPAGSHPFDPIVLTPDFDYAAATPPQRARWQTVMDAADDWAEVMGVILAHEVGHSVGLVAPGNAPSGLFGDASLHNTFASAAEVMAPSVGYEAMATLEYRFRDVDLAYLRQRVLLR